MEHLPALGRIVILNGVPRAGKTSIVRVIQDTFEGVWTNLGVDVFAGGATPKRYQPEVHEPGIYDLEVDTSLLSPEDCAERIRQRLTGGPAGTAFPQLAQEA